MFEDPPDSTWSFGGLAIRLLYPVRWRTPHSFSRVGNAPRAGGLFRLQRIFGSASLNWTRAIRQTDGTFRSWRRPRTNPASQFPASLRMVGHRAGEAAGKSDRTPTGSSLPRIQLQYTISQSPFSSGLPERVNLTVMPIVPSASTASSA